MVYNLTELFTANNILEVTVASNNLTGTLFWDIILLALFIIILVSGVGKYDIRKVLMVDSLFITLIGFIGLALGFCAWWIIPVPIIIFAGSIISLLTSR